MKTKTSQSTTAPPDGPDTLFVGSLEKGFRVLHAFDDNHPSLGVTEIAARTGMDKSAAQRFSNTLHRLGYLQKDPTTRRYSPARKLLELGYLFLRHSRLAERAMPRMIDVAEKFHLTVNLAELDDCDVVYTIRIPHQTATYQAMIPGRRRPAYCTAPGLAILSHLPAAETRGILSRSDRKKFTPRTLTDLAGIERALARTRRDGFALTFDQLLPREISVAAPIFDHAGRAVAAVQMPVYRPEWTADEARERLGPAVLDLSRSISGRLLSEPPE